ncbi:MAG TPA: cupin domain-containing protein [Methylomirabilota bacterium]|nr:cupin domain-containing protein [Methylomirabilota bacterium]
MSDLVRGGEGGWRPLATPGSFVKVLHADRATGASTALIRFDAGTRFPAHNHPGGEEVFVVEGDLRIGGDLLGPGDYLYTPPDGKHAAFSERGCVFLVTVGKPIEILTES